MLIEDKIKLRDEIEKLNETQHIEIFKIFKKNSITFSENKNGIFINLNCVDDVIFNEIKEHILYIKKQEKYINKIENIKNDYKNEFFTDN
jgi:hypothetical protein